MNLFSVKLLRTIIIVSLFIELISCNSVNHFNEKYEKKISVKKLKSDIDFVHQKLNKLHPHLYDFIAKKDLDFKFDSLKNSINTPINRQEFYFKISPIIASIKQGHTRINVPTKKHTKSDIIEVQKNGLTPISKFKFEFYNDKLYIIENNSYDSTIKTGTEVVTIDSVRPIDMFSIYQKGITSDGYNQTFQKRSFSSNFSVYYFLTYDLKDSVLLKLKIDNEITTKYINRKFKAKKQSVSKEKFDLLAHYKKTANSSGDLSFIGEDSCTALLKVAHFSGDKYKEYFAKIDSIGSTELILDFRNNPGGSLQKSGKLFSYLIDSTYHYVFPFEVTSRTSILHTNRFRYKSIPLKIIHIAFLPLKIISSGLSLLFIKKEDNRYFDHKMTQSVKPAKENTFNGEIYTITNGGSFSAPCILSSNLKGYNLATFVGEETGGCYNGATAGLLPTFTLPHSQLNIIFGLLYVKPSCSSETQGRGIMPDKEIIPTLEDRINKVDPELEWILEEIKNRRKEY